MQSISGIKGVQESAGAESTLVRVSSPSLHATRAVIRLTVGRALQVACTDGDCIRTRRAILYSTSAGQIVAKMVC